MQRTFGLCGLNGKAIEARRQGIVPLTTRDRFAGQVEAMRALLKLMPLLEARERELVVDYFDATADFILLNLPPAANAARSRPASPAIPPQAAGSARAARRAA